MVQEVDDVLQVAPPGEAVAVYEVTGEPPLEAGALQVTVAWPLPGIAATAVGAPSEVIGVTAADGEDALAFHVARRAMVSKR